MVKPFSLKSLRLHIFSFKSKKLLKKVKSKIFGQMEIFLFLKFCLAIVFNTSATKMIIFGNVCNLEEGPFQKHIQNYASFTNHIS